MGLLSYTRLLKIIDDKIMASDPKYANATSIDVTLGNVIWIEEAVPNIIDLEAKQTPKMRRMELDADGYLLSPNEFILGGTVEKFNLPDHMSAEYKLNSSLARAGLDHLNAGWCDAGWNNSILTLEFKSCLRYQHLRLRPGMKCGQMVFFDHEKVPPEASYSTKGQYNGDKEAAPSKGLRLGDIVPIVNQPHSENRRHYEQA